MSFPAFKWEDGNSYTITGADIWQLGVSPSIESKVANLGWLILSAFTFKSVFQAYKSISVIFKTKTKTKTGQNGMYKLPISCWWKQVTPHMQFIQQVKSLNLQTEFTQA